MRLDLYRTTGKTGVEQKLGFFQRRPIKQALNLMAATSILCSVAVMVIQRHAIYDHLIKTSVISGLRLEEIRIKGRLNTDKNALIKAIGIEWHSPMVTLDINRIHHDVTDLGWVQSAIVKRQLPSTLEIKLQERQALALYQDDEGHLVIDQFGEVIKGIKPEDFTHLPVIKGPGAAVKAKSILTMLKAESSLYADVWSLTYQSQRRWDVYLRNNIRIQLPEIDPEKAWSELAEMNRKHKLTERDIVNIDLRVPDKLVIRPALNKVRKGSNT
jgi:cell division protein FtsQ